MKLAELNSQFYLPWGASWVLKHKALFIHAAAGKIENNLIELCSTKWKVCSRWVYIYIYMTGFDSKLASDWQGESQYLAHVSGIIPWAAKKKDIQNKYEYV